MYKEFIKKSAIFILIFLIITPFLGRFFLKDKNSILDGFYYEEENTLDVLFFGSSHSYCGINPNIIWEERGITSYNLGQPEQQIWMTYYYIKEALKYQNPKAIFMDVLTVNYDDEYMPIKNNNINLDTMKMSPNKLEAIGANVPVSERPYFIFDLLKNKSGWKDISKNNFTTNFEHTPHTNKGYWEWFEVYENKQPTTTPISEVGEIPPKAEEYLNKIIQLSKEENVPLVLMKTPVYTTDETQKRYNRVKEIASENGIEFIDFNLMYDELGIDFETDFIDEGKHLNFMGAEKVSKYIANYLQENFEIKNKKDDPKYKSWNDGLDIWKQKETAYYLRQTNNIDEYLSKIKSKDYIIAMTLKNKNINVSLMDKLSVLGINELKDLDGKNYIAIIDNYDVVAKQTGYNNFELKKDINTVSINIKFTGGKPSISINGNEYAILNNGLNILVYDKKLQKIIDNVNIEMNREITR